MRLRSTATAGIFAAFATVTSLTPTHAEASAPAVAAPSHEVRSGAVVLAGNGEVRAAFNAPWRPVRQGATLPGRAEVRAKDEPLRLQLARGATVELSPGASAIIVGHADIDIPRIGKLTAVRIDLARGEIAVTAPAAANPGDRKPVLVQGEGGLVALLLNGKMLVREMGSRRGDPKSGLAAATASGDVQFASGGGFHALPEGQVVELHDGRPTAPPRPLAASPEWRLEEGLESSGPLALVTDKDATAALTLRVQPTLGASTYDVEVADDEAFSSLVWRQSAPGSATAITTAPLAPGRYFARIRARGAEGLAGLPGPTRALRVALVTLPRGGAVEGGSFELPRNRTIKWDDPSGLEISIDHAGFGRAATELGLIHNEPTVAEVRLAGEHGFLPIELLPSAVRAEIKLGPKLAVWPADPVDVEVRLVNTRLPGPGSSSARFDPKLRVMVNLAEVPVSWRREGNLLRATVDRPVGGPGPWVVRVEARDPDDNPIGRGFLEVSSQR